MTAAELLEETARRVEAGPWGPGWAGPCVLRHLKDAALAGKVLDGELRTALEALYREIQMNTTTASCNVAWWNDHFAILPEEVATACRNAVRWVKEA